MVPASASVPGENSYRVLSLSHALKLISVHIWPGTFLPSASVPSSQASQLVHRPFKRRVLVSHSSGSLGSKPHSFSKLLELSPPDSWSQTSWGSSSQCSAPGQGMSDVDLELLTPQDGSSHLWCSSYLWVPHSGVGIPIRSHLYPSNHSQCSSLFTSLAVEECSAVL